MFWNESRPTACRLLIALCLFVLSGIATAIVDQTTAHDVQDLVAAEIQRTLKSLGLAVDQKPANLDVLADLYQRRAFQPLWSDDSGVKEAAHYWLSVLADAGQQGMTGAKQMREDLEVRLEADSIEQLADLDLMLSDSFLQLAASVAHGQFDPLTADPLWHIPSDSIQPVKLIERIAQDGEPSHAYRDLIPSHRSYRSLRTALKHYLQIQESGGWPQMERRGPQLQSGDRSAEVVRLREILYIMGDLPADTLDNELFDSDLERALKRFQRRHGLGDDGVAGARTRAELALGVEQRIEQIQLNLERWRWLPRELGERYIMVNTAGFELQAHQGGAAPLSMRVIVGRKKRPTPVFSEKLRYMTVNPYWHVPNRIAQRDLIPALIGDPDFFMKRGIRVLSDWQASATELDPLDIDWSDALAEAHIPYKLRQDPGPANALGRIKFMMPNRFNVYLHDTPGKHLFERQVRTFSSGCVRVEKPLELASFLLGNKRLPSATVDLETLIATGETRTISLPEPVPVYMVYQTAWVDGSGDLQFRRDIYWRDQRLSALLKGSSPDQTGQENAGKTSISQLLDRLP